MTISDFLQTSKIVIKLLTYNFFFYIAPFYIWAPEELSARPWCLVY